MPTRPVLFKLFWSAALVAPCGCKHQPQVTAMPAIPSPSVPLPEQAAGFLRVRSKAFVNGQPIPKKYTEDGSNISPPLNWMDVPGGTKELALIMDDPDAPR